MNFIIKRRVGIKYSKISKDTNPIHTDDLSGYNSIFGENICHGCLIVETFFKKIKFLNKLNKLNITNIYINFLKHSSYNQLIKIKKKNNKYYFFQNKKKIIEITFRKKMFINYKKPNNINKIFKVKNSVKVRNYKYRLVNLLHNLSRYVGTINPGKYSLISSININFNKKFDFDNNVIKIFSRKPDKRIPTIENSILTSKFYVEFQSLERPNLIKRKVILKKSLIKYINHIKTNVLIVGASQGIGQDFYNLLNINKNIKVFGTYYKNKLKKKNKVIKLDVNKDLKIISNLIDKLKPVSIYYFVSPKILLNKVDKITIKNFEKYFINVPIKIIKKNYNKKISFFYPSTINIKTDRNSDYSKIKLKAEKKLKKICHRLNVPLKTFRFPALKSRQTLSLINSNLPTFLEYMNKNTKLKNNFFF